MQHNVTCLVGVVRQVLVKAVGLLSVATNLTSPCMSQVRWSKDRAYCQKWLVSCYSITAMYLDDHSFTLSPACNLQADADSYIASVDNALCQWGSAY